MPTNVEASLCSTKGVLQLYIESTKAAMVNPCSDPANVLLLDPLAALLVEQVGWRQCPSLGDTAVYMRMRGDETEFKVAFHFVFIPVV